jgi:hypothetical protein
MVKRHLHTFFISILMMGLLAPGTVIAQQMGFFLPPDVRKVDIPFELHNNLIVLPVIINNKLPLKFVFDTGVRTAILTEKTFSDLLNLSYSRKITIAGAGGENLVDAYITNNVALELPGVKGRGHALLVLETDYIELSAYLGTSVHGILGYEVFSRFVVKIDYANKVVTLYRPEFFKPGKRFKKIPIKVEDTKPYITSWVQLSETGEAFQVKLLMDTGASLGILLDPQTDPRILMPEKGIDSNLGRGLAGNIEGKVGRIQSVSLGNFQFYNPIVTFPYENSYIDSLRRSLVFRNGSIGGSVMSRFTVVFDFSNEYIYLKKNSNFKKRFDYDLSGLVVKAKGNNYSEYEIVQVRESSPAFKAGLKEGDMLLQVNGVSTKDLKLGNIIDLLNSKPGKKMRLRIKRNMGEKTVEFRLRDQI